MKKLTFIAVALVALMCSCTGNKFKVAGNVKGAGDTATLFLEASINGKWLLIDSTVTSGDGFSMAEEAPQYPNIYRLTYRDKSIYFPIDSIDQIKIETSIKKFDEDYNLSGSKNAEMMAKYDKQLNKFARSGDLASPAFKQWKDGLNRAIAKDPAGIVSYYFVNKQVAGRPLYDPLDKTDFKIIGAVTNAFDNFRPNDPRRDFMVETFKMALAQRRSTNASAPRDTIVATQASLIEIKLQDKKGKMQSLQEVASHGNVVILNFTMYSQTFSPSLNKLLNDVYSKYKSRGLEIFQVSLDENEAQWMQAAASLPWIVMRDTNGENSTYASAYAVGSVPAIFIIGRNGEIVERVENIEQLDAVVAKYM